MAADTQDKKKGLHTGHRSRMKQRFINSQGKNFNEHELLEILLYYSTPQQDTNPIAHELINKFGSLKGVFDADIEALKSIDYVKENSAVLIKLFSVLFEEYQKERLNVKKIASMEQAGEYLWRTMQGETNECVYMICLDESQNILKTEKIVSGSINSSCFNVSDVIKSAILVNANKIFLSHNHPSGSAMPSSLDLTTTATLQKALLTGGIRLLEHFIITKNNYTGILTGFIGKISQ